MPAGSEDALVGAMKAALAASQKSSTAKGQSGRERVLRLHDAQGESARIFDAIESRLDETTSLALDMWKPPATRFRQ